MPLESIEIPIKNSSQVIEVPIGELPDSVSEICEILDSEDAPLALYLKFAKFYYHRSNFDAYRLLLEHSLNKKNRHVVDQKSYIAISAHLASMLINLSLFEHKDKKKVATLIEEATVRLNEADKLDFEDENTLCVKGILLMFKKSFENATYHFNLVLEKHPKHPTALCGLAIISYVKMEFRESLSYFKRLLKYLGSDAPAFVRVGIGMTQMRLKNYAIAAEAFKRALQVDPKCKDAHVLLSQIQFLRVGSQNFDAEVVQSTILKGFSSLNAAVSIEKGNWAALYEVGLHHFYRSEWPIAHAVASEAFAIAENDVCRSRCSFLLGRIFHANNHFDEAFRYYSQCVKFDTSFDFVHFSLAQVYLHQNDHLKSIESLKKFLRTYPRHYEALKVICVLGHTVGYDKVPEFCEHIKFLSSNYPDDLEAQLMAATFFEDSHPQVAFERYTCFVEGAQSSGLSVPAEVRNNMALLQLQLNNPTLALELINSLLESIDSASDCVMKSIRLQAMFNQGMIYETLKQTDSATSVYQKILSECSSYIDCYLRLASIKMKCDAEYGTAIEFLNEALKIDPNSKAALILNAQVHRVTKSYSQCRKSYENILKSIDKHDVYSLLSLGNLFIDQARRAPDKNIRTSDLHRASEFFQKALSINNHSFNAVNGLAICFYELGHVNTAKDLFLQLKQTESDFGDSWVNLSHVYMNGHQTMIALNLYESANRKFFNGRDPILLMFMAKCYYILGKIEGNVEHLESAIACLEKAIELQTKDDLIWYNLAMCQHEYASVRLLGRSTISHAASKNVAVAKGAVQDSSSVLAEAHQAVKGLESAIKIYSNVLNWKDESVGAAADGHLNVNAVRLRKSIYDKTVLKKRLKQALDLKEKASLLIANQDKELQRRTENLAQLKEYRRIQQEKEQLKIAEIEAKKAQQESEIAMQRSAVQERVNDVRNKLKNSAINDDAEGDAKDLPVDKLADSVSGNNRNPKSHRKKQSPAGFVVDDSTDEDESSSAEYHEHLSQLPSKSEQLPPKSEAKSDAESSASFDELFEE